MFLSTPAMSWTSNIFHILSLRGPPGRFIAEISVFFKFSRPKMRVLGEFFDKNQLFGLYLLKTIFAPDSFRCAFRVVLLIVELLVVCVNCVLPGNRLLKFILKTVPSSFTPTCGSLELLLLCFDCCCSGGLGIESGTFCWTFKCLKRLLLLALDILELLFE